MEGHKGSVWSVAISPDGKYALSGSSDRTLKLWDLETGKCIRTMEGHTSIVSSVAISPDNRYALSGSGEGTAKLWEIETGRCIRTMEGHTESVFSVAISSDGRYALSGSGDKTLKLWRLIWDLEFPEPVDWDEGVRPYLEIFLRLRNGKWNEEDFNKLINELASMRCYGWVKPKGIRKELEKMTRKYEE
jgi:WD40 repeat protein